MDLGALRRSSDMAGLEERELEAGSGLAIMVWERLLYADYRQCMRKSKSAALSVRCCK